MTICVIPARGGSKRIPKKNIKIFYGRPMIEWAINTAKNSNIFEDIIVSTDDDEIAQIALNLGVSVPFIRPKELSNDFADTSSVIAHACEWIDKTYPDENYVCCLYATAAFTNASDLNKALNILNSQKWDYVFSACEYPSTIFRSFEQIENEGVRMFFPHHFEARSQDLPIALHDAGMFYMGTKDAWKKKLPIFGESSYPFRVPRWRVQDIDTLEDWKRAEKMSTYILDIED